MFIPIDVQAVFKIFSECGYFWEAVKHANDASRIAGRTDRRQVELACRVSCMDHAQEEVHD